MTENTEFVLHPQLEKDTFLLGSLELTEVLLMNDSRYTWLILVPRCPNICDVTDLTSEDRQKLMEEMNFVGESLKREFQPERLNIAMLGNVVPQLHCHVIVRYKDDFAFPKPVWGVGDAIPYIEEKKEAKLSLLKQLLFP